MKIRMNRNSLKLAFAAAAVASIATLSPAVAGEPDMNVGHGLICDTLKQVERFATLQANGEEANEALETVNRGVAGAPACAIGLVRFTDDNLVARLSINGKPASVFKITVHAFSRGSDWSEVWATVQYILVPEEGLIA